MNDTDVQAPNTDCKPKLHKNCKLVLQILLVNHNVVPGSPKMLLQEHVALGKISFCISAYHTCCVLFVCCQHLVYCFSACCVKYVNLII